MAPPVAARLLRVLKFRHFLRHAYAVDLDWEKMREVAAGLASLHADAAADIGLFSTHVAACLADL